MRECAIGVRLRVEGHLNDRHRDSEDELEADRLEHRLPLAVCCRVRSLDGSNRPDFLEAATLF